MGFRRDAGSPGPRPGPEIEWLEDDRSPDEDPLWMAGQVLTLADDKAAQIAQAAEHEAARIHEAAQREAAAIRDAAAQEAGELRAQLNSMLDELSRLVAHLTESVAAPTMSAIAPAMPATAPAMPAAATLPGLEPALDGASPARTAASPARPGVRPATKPAGRQARAMRKMVAAFAAVSVLGAGAGISELGLHGLPFFIFRANGAGATETGPREPANPPRAGEPFLPSAHHQQTTRHQPANGKESQSSHLGAGGRRTHAVYPV